MLTMCLVSKFSSELRKNINYYLHIVVVVVFKKVPNSVPKISEQDQRDCQLRHFPNWFTIAESRHSVLEFSDYRMAEFETDISKTDFT